MVVDTSRNTSGLADGTNSPFRIFSDQHTITCLPYVNHTETNKPYNVKFQGRDLHWLHGVVYVFLLDVCGASDNMMPIYRECVHESTEMRTEEMTRCVYHCIPTGNSQSTYVRFNKVKFTTADYETWLLHYMALMCRHLSYVIDIKKT